MVSLRLYARDGFVAAELLRHLLQRLQSSRQLHASISVCGGAGMGVNSLFAPVLAPLSACLCGRACVYGCEDVDVVEDMLK